MEQINQNEVPNYYAIIPATVRYDRRLPARAALLYGEITALSNSTGICWASDGYFKRIYHAGSTTVQQWLKKLEECGYIKREIVYKDDKKTIDKRYIRILPSNNPLTPTPENGGTPTPENGVDSITSNNTSNKDHSCASTTSGLNGLSVFSTTQKVIEYLNQKTDKRYSYKSNANKKLAKARIDEGYTLDDFKTVIDNKVNDWINDDEMTKYLRPATLFGNKFDTYLNQKPVSKTPQKNWSTNQDVKYQSEQYYRDLGL